MVRGKRPALFPCVPPRIPAKIPRKIPRGVTTARQVRAERCEMNTEKAPGMAVPEEENGDFNGAKYWRKRFQQVNHERLRLISQAQGDAREQPRLTVRLTSFPESNGKRNWTALLVREEKWGGLIGNAGGITVARGELWNRVAYEAERARFLLGQRGTEPFILDYGDDIETPEEWTGETRLAARASNGGKA